MLLRQLENRDDTTTRRKCEVIFSFNVKKNDHHGGTEDTA